MFLFRAFLVWLLIIFVETIHGTLRQMFVAPAVGDFRARQIAVFTGIVLIFAVAYFFIGWIRAENAKRLLAVGLTWAGLTLIFEFGLGFFVFGFSSERMLEDYDISRGGLMAFGLLFMIFAPYLAAKLKFNHEQTRTDTKVF